MSVRLRPPPRPGVAAAAPPRDLDREGEQPVSEWKNYRKKSIQPMRPYVPGESLENVSVSAEDTPEEGGMIAQNPSNPADQWYVAKDFFRSNYEEV